MEFTEDVSLFEQMILYFQRALESFAESLHFQKLSRLAFEAASFNLGLAGETADQISKSFRKSVEQINWKKLIRTRHIMFHAYGKVDPTEIHTILADNLPHLLKHFQAILKSKKEEI